MATEDTDTEAGGQAEDSGDTGESEESTVSDEGEKQVAGEGEAPRPSRTQRRANRFQEERNARTRAEQERDELRGRYTSLEQQFNEFRQEIARDKREAQRTDASTETRQKVSGLRQQARGYLVASANEKDPNRAQQLLDKHDELMDQADDLRDEMRDEARWEKRRGELAGQIPNQNTMAERSYFESRYPWLSTNKKAQALADAHYVELVEGGRPAGRATLEQAVTWAAKVLGIGGRATPSPLSRQVYAGTSQRDGEMDDSAPSGGITVEDVKNNLAFKRMAQLTFNQDDPDVAYAKWAKMQNNANKNGAGAR